MPSISLTNNESQRQAYIITGPTSGIGRLTASELAKHGTVVLVGPDRKKLDEVQETIEQKGGSAVPVVCDLSDIASVRRAAAGIIALRLPIAGLLNNAGIMQMRATQNALGWDMTFATDHLGPFALTEALMPHLPDGAKSVGFDAYATSKQSTLATALELARENPRMHINAVEPGFNPGTALGRDVNVFIRFLSKYVLTLLAPHIKYWSTSKRAARVITKVLINESVQTGVYYDEKGHPMLGSELVRDPKFTARVVAETRSLLATVPA